MPRPSICSSVRLSVCDDELGWAHKLEYFENNFAPISPNIDDVVQLQHPQNSGERGGVTRAKVTIDN